MQLDLHLLKLKRNIITADIYFDNIFYNFYVCHEIITYAIIAITQIIYFQNALIVSMFVHTYH